MLLNPAIFSQFCIVSIDLLDSFGSTDITLHFLNLVENYKYFATVLYIMQVPKGKLVQDKHFLLQNITNISILAFQRIKIHSWYKFDGNLIYYHESSIIDEVRSMFVST